MNIVEGPYRIYGQHDPRKRVSEVTRTSVGSFNDVLYGIWTFIGFDRGDLAEADIEIWDHDHNLPIYLRSEHKETSGIYDAWRFFRVQYSVWDRILHHLKIRPLPKLGQFRWHFHGHVTADEPNLGDHPQFARVHFGVHLVGSDGLF